MMIDFFTISVSDLRQWMLENEYPAFQAEQIFAWIYEKNVLDWNAMTNLSAPLRTALVKAFRLSTLKLVNERSNDSGVHKFSWGLIDGSVVETVLTLTRQGWHQTLSTQVGCPAACVFCASGKRFVRNLQPAEVIEQYLRAKAWAAERGSKEIIHVAFDGMGEPLKNVKSLMAAIEGLSQAGMRPNRMTVSTVGLVEGIEQLLTSRVRINLRVGLHAANQSLRQKIVPYAKRNRMDVLISVCRRYAMQTGLPVMFDYVMIAGLNDSPDQALELAHLIKQLRCQVRLIPCNPILGFKGEAPSKKAIKAFRTVLFGSKIVNALYEEQGASIVAGLGQLAVRTA